jgi:hypothetical protein
VGGARGQSHRPEAREHTHRLQRPQSPRQPQRSERVGAERKQRAVRRVLKRPPDEREHGVGRDFGRNMRVGVQAVQHSQPRKRQVAEHILGDQRRPQQQHQVGHHDRRHDRLGGKRPCGQQHGRIAHAHDERQRLEAARVESQSQAVQRTRQPPRPSAAAAATPNTLNGAPISPAAPNARRASGERAVCSATLSAEGRPFVVAARLFVSPCPESIPHLARDWAELSGR